MLGTTKDIIHNARSICFYKCHYAVHRIVSYVKNTRIISLYYILYNVKSYSFVFILKCNEYKFISGTLWFIVVRNSAAQKENCLRFCYIRIYRIFRYCGVFALWNLCLIILIKLAKQCAWILSAKLFDNLQQCRQPSAAQRDCLYRSMWQVLP